MRGAGRKPRLCPFAWTQKFASCSTYARIKGQSITAVVEHSVRDTANNTSITYRDDYNNLVHGKSWPDFWDPSDGVRTLNLLSDPNYPTDYNEDRIRQFTLDHWQFFYTSEDNRVLRRGYVDILWPRILEFCEIWDRTKAENYWAAGEAMLATIHAARLPGPASWPPAGAKPNRPTVADELDDDIPF